MKKIWVLGLVLILLLGANAVLRHARAAENDNNVIDQPGQPIEPAQRYGLQLKLFVFGADFRDKLIYSEFVV